MSKCNTCGKLPVEETCYGCETDDEYEARLEKICRCDEDE